MPHVPDDLTGGPERPDLPGEDDESDFGARVVRRVRDLAERKPLRVPGASRISRRAVRGEDVGARPGVSAGTTSAGPAASPEGAADGDGRGAEAGSSIVRRAVRRRPRLPRALRRRDAAGPTAAEGAPSDPAAGH